MQPRLLIAYLLIGLMIAAAALLVRHIARKRWEHRQLMRGRLSHKRASARR
jgi:hypothetical protein